MEMTLDLTLKTRFFKIILFALILPATLYFTWHLGRLYETKLENKRWESIVKVSPGIIVDWETEFDPETGKIVSITYWLE